MTPEQKKLVQASYALILPNADSVGKLFYTRLFVIDSALRPLFTGTIAERAHSLMTTMTVVIHSLNSIEKITPTLYMVGARHYTYGVRAEHYMLGGGVLLWTLEQALGTMFTSEVRDAWIAAYTLITDTMQAGVPARI